MSCAYACANTAEGMHRQWLPYEQEVLSELLQYAFVSVMHESMCTFQTQSENQSDGTNSSDNFN